MNAHARSLSLRDWGLLILVCLGLFLPGFASLPPTDRDESRYVVTSERMADTGDYIDLRFQEQPRYLQPAGIYWLQAISAVAFDSPGHDSIWAYRVPSLLGALFAVLLTGWIGAHFFGRTEGLIAAALLAACFSLNFEARIAKIDAALLASIVAAQLALMRAYVEPNSGRWTSGLFWAALGVGVLLKGPIVLIVSGTTIGALVLWDRKASWLMRLRPIWGPLITIAIAAPWLIAIGVISHGGFYQRSVVRNFLGKVGAGEQGHHGPPGYHLALFIFAFWPGSLLALRAVGHVWRERAQPTVRFLLCWIAPTWIIFELTATKLPHYVLPTYPAIACLAAAALVAPNPANDNRLRTIVFAIASALWLGASVAIAAAAPLALSRMQSVTDPIAIGLAVLVVIAAIMALWLLWRGRLTHALAALTFAAAFAWLNIFGYAAPRLDDLWLSRRIDATARAVQPCIGAPLITTPYSEPSLVFLYGRTRTHITATGAEAADALAAASPCGLALIGENKRSEFLTRAAGLGLNLTPLTHIAGKNYSDDANADLILYSLAPAQPAPEPDRAPR
ncbi:MAG: glycosyltransferase family 39 protein [Terricaulis silvestris]